MLYKTIEEKKTCIPSELILDLICCSSASKLKRGVTEKKLVDAFGFPYSWIFLPPIFLLFFFLPWIVMGTLSVNHFQSNLFYILYDIRLSSTFLWTFFSNVIFCVCSLLFFFSLNPMSILPELLDTSTVQLLTK